MTDEREIISQLKNPKTQRAAFGLIVRQAHPSYGSHS